MIKDFHFGKIRSFLPNRLKQHEDIAKKAKNTRDLANVNKYLALFTKAKEERKYLLDHISLADYLVTLQNNQNYWRFLNYEQSLLTDEEIPRTLHNFCQNKLWSQQSKTEVLKLICLECMTHGGLPQKYYEEFRKDFLNIYGYQEMIFLKNLEKIKVLYLKGKDKELMSYSYIFKQLNLLKNDVDIKEPDSPSYVFSGLSPIIVRLIENIMRNGWNSMIPILSKIPGDFTATVGPNEEMGLINRNKEKENFILVVFLGGVTYAEIGALRMLGKILNNANFIILTTHIITTSRFFEEMKGGMLSNDKYTTKQFYNDYLEWQDSSSKKK